MGDLIVFFTRQTIRPGEQGQCRQSTSAQLRNERRAFLFSNRQQRHWISERLTRAQWGSECYWIPLSGWQTARPHGSLLPCHSWWFAFKVVIQREGKKKAQFSCHSCLAIASSTAAQPRGSGKRMACYALLWSLFILRFSQREMIIASPSQNKTKQNKK